MLILSHPLVLGSASPRRQQLLQGMGFTFTTRVLEVDESFPPDLEITQVAEFLAKKKADAHKKQLKNELLITADTIVALNGEVLGKPENIDHAAQLLRKQSGKKQTVYTGVCLLTESESYSFSVATDVFFRPLSESEIQYYLANYKPFDKAGSYGVQEWMGYVGVARIEGSYTNVMGFPTSEVYNALQKFAL